MPILILAVIFLIGLGCGAAVWLVFERRRRALSKALTKDTTSKHPFQWRYIILPLAILAIAIILSAYFYRLLPTEVAYHFKPDGTPDKWLSRGMVMVWVLAPQFSLALLATAIVWGITKLNMLTLSSDSIGIKPESMLSFMGNIVALPQFIVGFAMLDIFRYNVSQTHIMPMWLFLLIFLGLATIGLGVFFILVIVRVIRQQSSRQKTKED